MTKKQRLLVSLMLATGAGMLILAALSAGGSETDITVDGVEEIDAIFPLREASILRDDEVGVDLAAGFVAALSFELSDGTLVDVPADQLNPNQQSAGFFIYRPEQNKIVEFFPPGSNCVTATYWPVEDREDVSSIRWCFEVQF